MKQSVIVKNLILGSALLFALPNCGSDDKKKKPKTEEIKPAPTPEPKEEIIDDKDFVAPVEEKAPSSGNSKFKFAPMFRHCVEFDGRPWYVCTTIADIDKNGGKFGYIRKTKVPEALGKLFFKKFKGLSEEKSRSCVWWYDLKNTKPTICSRHTQ